MCKALVPNHGVHATSEPGDHPDLDKSHLLGAHETAITCR